MNYLCRLYYQQVVVVASHLGHANQTDQMVNYFQKKLSMLISNHLHHPVVAAIHPPDIAALPIAKNADTFNYVNSNQLLFVNQINNLYCNQHQWTFIQEFINPLVMLTLLQKFTQNKVDQMFKSNQLLLKLKKKLRAKWFVDTNMYQNTNVIHLVDGNQFLIHHHVVVVVINKWF